MSLVDAGKSHHVGMTDVVLQWISDLHLSAGKESSKTPVYELMVPEHAGNPAFQLPSTDMERQQQEQLP